MTTTSTASTTNAASSRRYGAARWLTLAAAPTFGLMAWLAAGDRSAMALCTAGTSLLPLDGMTAMYLLMCLFHLPPWFRLASNHRWTHPQATTEGDAR